MKKAYTHKIVLVIQDLEVKGGDKVAIVSGDVHYHRDSKEQMSYGLLTQQLKEEKHPDKEKIPKNPKEKILFLLRYLGYKLKAKAEIEETVKELTTLTLEDKNLDEILVRLGILATQKDEAKINEIQNELLKLKHVASFQMALDSNKDFQRHINSLVMEAITLREKENK